jgi:CDP-diacylglycerol pyrophosphatase
MNKNKRHMLIAIMIIVVILAVSSVMMMQIRNHHQANKLIIDKCFEHFDKEGSVVIKKDSIWSPVICVKK